MEKKVQTKILQCLRRNKFYVIKTRPGPGTPTGCPDILFFKEGFWGAIEVKAYEDSYYQVGQELTLAKLNDWSWARTAHSSNVQQIIAEIDALA